MAAEDPEIFSKRIRVENKTLFVDVRENSTGLYLKLSERRGDKRNSIIIPASGISELNETLVEAFATAFPQKQIKKPTTAPAVSTVPTTVVKVGNLSFDTTEESLAAHFRAAGRVAKATIILRNSKDKQISTGRGTVEFEDVAGATIAVQTLNQTELDGRPINVQGSKREQKEEAAVKIATTPSVKTPGGPAPGKVASTTKVYVNNLSWETSDGDLENYFGRVGEVKSCSIRKSKSGRSFGQGIVEFATASGAADSVERLNNTELDGRQIAVRSYYETV